MTYSCTIYINCGHVFSTPSSSLYTSPIRDIWHHTLLPIVFCCFPMLAFVPLFPAPVSSWLFMSGACTSLPWSLSSDHAISPSRTHCIQKQSKPFLVKRKKILQNLILLSATYLLRNSRTVCMQKPNTNLLLNFKSVIRLFLTHHYYTPHIYLVLYAYLKPPLQKKKNSQGVKNGESGQVTWLSGKYSLFQFLLFTSGSYEWHFSFFFTLISCLLPLPTTYVIKRISPPYLKLSIVFCYSLLIFKILTIASKVLNYQGLFIFYLWQILQIFARLAPSLPSSSPP